MVKENGWLRFAVHMSEIRMDVKIIIIIIIYLYIISLSLLDTPVVES